MSSPGPDAGAESRIAHRLSVRASRNDRAEAHPVTERLTYRWRAIAPFPGACATSAASRWQTRRPDRFSSWPLSGTRGCPFCGLPPSFANSRSNCSPESFDRPCNDALRLGEAPPCLAHGGGNGAELWAASHLLQMHRQYLAPVRVVGGSSRQIDLLAHRIEVLE
jgi:hypothetical protein